MPLLLPPLLPLLPLELPLTLPDPGLWWVVDDDDAAAVEVGDMIGLLLAFGDVRPPISGLPNDEDEDDACALLCECTGDEGTSTHTSSRRGDEIIMGIISPPPLPPDCAEAPLPMMPAAAIAAAAAIVSGSTGGEAGGDAG